MPALTLPEVIMETKPGATVILEARSTKKSNVLRLCSLKRDMDVEERSPCGLRYLAMANDDGIERQIV